VEGEQVVGFVVGGAVLPAFPEDADPFKGESAQDGLVAFAGALLLSVEGLGPDAAGHGLASPFDKTLPQELRTVPTPVHPHELAALFADGRDAGVFLKRGGIGITRAVGAKRSQEPRSKRWARAGQLSEQGGIGMSGEGFGNAVFQILDRGLQWTQLGDQQRGLGDGHVDDRGVRGDGAEVATVASGRFPGHQAQITHEVTGMLEPSHIGQFGPEDGRVVLVDCSDTLSLSNA